MRLLQISSDNEPRLTEDLSDNIPPYAILSHTWGADADEVTFSDLINGQGRSKKGYAKLRFCEAQARQEGIEFFWIDTCCINKNSHVELSEAIISMFRWYSDAVVCYVYLSDVSIQSRSSDGSTQVVWGASFRTSRWFTRGWTLQELLAPNNVKFFSFEGELLGSKIELAQQIHDITTIPIAAIHGTPLTQFPIAERLRWAENRQTKKKEDRAYCLLGIFEVYMPLIYGEGDHAFMRLQKEINNHSDSSNPYNHRHWLVPRTSNPLFTGREDVLQKLEAIVRTAIDTSWGRSQCRIVILGMGGQGKSEVCLQLARRLKQLFESVFWIDVSKQDIAERSFLQIAQKLALPAQVWHDGLSGIANLARPWLLILDNADDPDIYYRDYFPDGPHGVVIMTTRNAECQRYGSDEVIVLKGLRDTEAPELLLKAANLPLNQGDSHEEAAKKVADLLQSHPLALIQAGAYVARGHCTLTDYPNLYEKQRQRLLTFRPAQARSRYRDVYATFEVSAAMLAAAQTPAAQDALVLLPLLSVGAPNHLPMNLFQAAWHGARLVPLDLDEHAADDNVSLMTPWHVARLPAFIDIKDDAWDDFRLTEAMALLKAFSLVSVTSNNGVSMVSLHPLVHAWARDRQDEKHKQQTWLQMGCIISLASTQREVSMAEMRSLQPHVEALTDWDLAKVFPDQSQVLVARILVHCGWFLHDQSADTRLYTLLQRLFVRLGMDMLKVDESWIGLYYLAAINAGEHGKIGMALKTLDQVVKIHEQTLSEDHPDLLASQHELAKAYQLNGQIKEALALQQHVVNVGERTLADSEPRLLHSQHQLALSYFHDGRLKETIMLLEHVVKVRKETLPEDNHDLLMSQHSLACAYKVDRQMQESITLLEHVVKVQKVKLPENHPRRTVSQHELARAYRANGQITEAVALLEHVVKIKDQTLAEDHPARLTSQHELARAYQHNGQIDEALALIEHVVKVQESSLAESHPDRLASEHVLASIYQSHGRMSDALSLLERVVQIQELTLADDHPDQLASKQLFAVTLWYLERYSESYKILKSVVELMRLKINKNHPDLVDTEGWLVIMENHFNRVDTEMEPPD